MSKVPWAEAGLHRAFRREYDPSPSEKGNRRPPRGPGHVQHSCRVQRCLYLFAKAEGSDPSPGIGYCIQQMTRLSGICKEC